MNPFVHNSSFSDLYDISLLPEENTSSTAPSIRFVKFFFFGTTTPNFSFFLWVVFFHWLKKVHLWIVLSLHRRKKESMSLNELFRIRAPWFRDDVYLKKILPLSIWTKSLLGKDCTIFTYVIEVLVMTEACYTHLEMCRYDLQSAQCFQASLGTRGEVTLSFRSRLFIRFKTMAKGKRY